MRKVSRRIFLRWGCAERAVVLDNPEYHLETAGATFAGRDVFAPAAAHLCNGVDLMELGTEIDAALLLPGTIPLPRNEGDTVVAEVLWIDRFGNCQLNVGPDDLDGWDDRLQLRLGAPTEASGVTVRTAVRATSFAGIAGGGLGLVLDSYGMLAICLDQRSAADELHLGPGDQVVLAPLADESGAGSSPNPVTETPVHLGRHR
jgi:S-adenosyl-L-methionine hydrolase (adenosine-forming)